MSILVLVFAFNYNDVTFNTNAIIYLKIISSVLYINHKNIHAQIKRIRIRIRICMDRKIWLKMPKITSMQSYDIMCLMIIKIAYYQVFEDLLSQDCFLLC